MQFDHLVFIGRFEPFHHGHRAVIERALTLASRVIVLVGSANKPRTNRNPWNAHEREVMIRESFPESRDRILVRPLRDHLYNETQWVTEVQRIVHAASEGSQKVGLIGYSKDRTSYYLKSFPQWKLVEAPNVEGVSATELRHSLFLMDEDPGQRLLLEAGLPDPVFEMLMAFRTRPQFQQLRKEFAFIRDYRKGWEAAPYAPTFVTVDAVVVHSGHVLLVRRKAEPGKGLLALPGGFLNQDETIQDAAIRSSRKKPASSCRSRCCAARFAACTCSITRSAHSAAARSRTRSTSIFRPANCRRCAEPTTPRRHAGIRRAKRSISKRASSRTTITSSSTFSARCDPGPHRGE